MMSAALLTAFRLQEILAKPVEFDYQVVLIVKPRGRVVHPVLPDRQVLLIRQFTVAQQRADRRFRRRTSVGSRPDGHRNANGAPAISIGRGSGNHQVLALAFTQPAYAHVGTEHPRQKSDLGAGLALAARMPVAFESRRLEVALDHQLAMSPRSQTEVGGRFQRVHKLEVPPVESVLHHQFRRSVGHQRKALHEEVCPIEFFHQRRESVVVTLIGQNEYQPANRQRAIPANHVLATRCFADADTMTVERADDGIAIQLSAVGQVGSTVWTDRIHGVNAILVPNQHQGKVTQCGRSQPIPQLPFERDLMPSAI
ncbi:hypothetical protein SBA4_7660008 [Candidatus Sulfopaludibacter sp. SbA4]|nr:hypothetical protein SBA4_7660008 [Candidatus Sulfopaludibacter sp. SbA4]